MGIKKLNEYDEYSLKNRDKKRQPKRTKFWCEGCDANIVGLNNKCSVCGFKLNSPRDKKW